MNKQQFHISLAIGAACILLTIVQIIMVQANRSVQAELIERQAALATTQGNQRIATALLRDMAVAARSNSKIKELLVKHGFVAADQQTNP
jgi:hypothetical protein